MPWKYIQTTNRGAAEDDLVGTDRVREGCSIRGAAKDSNITLAEQFHGLTRNKCRELIVEYALRKNATVPDSWQQNGIIGDHFWISFKERNHLAIRTPEATSLARASAFNRYNVGTFYNLMSVMDLHKFECHDIYKADETNRVRSETSRVYNFRRERTTLTVVDYIIKSGPASCIGGANSNRWINEDLFVTSLKHFIAYTRGSKEKKVLLILDNHETHLSLAAID
uniref:DDE-1 domain-containing protein n=1 Tax=Octopus bimaculoides TaxID=37653 RepID=A0A0L8H014_OCTBM